MYGDLNADGKIDSADYGILKRYLYSKIKKFSSDKTMIITGTVSKDITSNDVNILNDKTNEEVSAKLLDKAKVYLNGKAIASIAGVTKGTKIILIDTNNDSNYEYAVCTK